MSFELFSSLELSTVVRIPKIMAFSQEVMAAQ